MRSSSLIIVFKLADGGVWIFIDFDGHRQLRQYCRYFSSQGENQVEDEKARKNCLIALQGLLYRALD